MTVSPSRGHVIGHGCVSPHAGTSHGDLLVGAKGRDTPTPRAQGSGLRHKTSLNNTKGENHRWNFIAKMVVISC